MKFFKLLKYEFLENISSIALVNSALLILLFVMRVYLNSDFSSMHWFVGVIVIIAPVAIFASLIFLITIIVRSLYSRLFGKEGYLTLSLPVSIDSILISKILISMFWVLISVFIVWLWLFIVVDSRYNIMQKIFFVISNNYNFLDIVRIIFLTLIFIIKPIVLLLFVLSILHIGKITKFKQFTGIILFMFILFIENIITNFIYVSINDTFYSMNPMVLFYGSIDYKEYSFMILIYFCISLLPIFVYYFLSRYLIKNKLEI